MDKALPDRRVVSAAGSRQDPVYTKQKREVATKPFSHSRSLKNVLYDRLGPRILSCPGFTSPTSQTVFRGPLSSPAGVSCPSPPMMK